MMKLLLIEDNREIALALRQALAATHSVIIANTGQEGISNARTKTFDAIILDLQLPDLPGLEVCEAIRAHDTSTPILVVTSETSVLRKIKLLDAGANDYLNKPFSLGELKARLRVLERTRTKYAYVPQNISAGNLVLDIRNHSVVRDGQTIYLRRKEFTILECLMRHANNVVSREILGNYAWHEGEKPWANTIDVHIKYLRDKIDRPFNQKLIHTVHGLGYRFQQCETDQEVR